jgi:hypothetical protein
MRLVSGQVVRIGNAIRVETATALRFSRLVQAQDFIL